jgi:aminoglycoside phosphotransferase (APT) family kinase protein
MPENAIAVKVSNLQKLSGGVTNELFSFLLTFTAEGFEHKTDLVLKGYPEKAAAWFKTPRPDEDVRKYVREFQSMQSLSNIGFPVPQAYLCETDPFFLGYPFVIMSLEKVAQESVNRIDCFASTLASLHNLKADEVGVRSLGFPSDGSAYAMEWPIRLRQLMSETKHYRSLRKDFDHAISWLELNAADNDCPQYCLVHGEYHPGHTIITRDDQMKVIDWEGVEIGDPAFDVGYAYHMVKLMCNIKNDDSGERTAEQFISEYSRSFRGDVSGRLEFYKVVGILGVAIEVSSWISNPSIAYKRFGLKALPIALAYPFRRLNFVAKKWLNSDFLASYLEYSQDFIKTTLKR